MESSIKPQEDSSILAAAVGLLVWFLVRCGSTGVGYKRDVVLCGKAQVFEGERLVNLIFSKQTARAQPQLVNYRAKDLMQTEV